MPPSFPAEQLSRHNKGHQCNFTGLCIAPTVSLLNATSGICHDKISHDVFCYMQRKYCTQKQYRPRTCSLHDDSGCGMNAVVCMHTVSTMRLRHAYGVDKCSITPPQIVLECQCSPPLKLYNLQSTTCFRRSINKGMVLPFLGMCVCACFVHDHLQPY